MSGIFGNFSEMFQSLQEKRHNRPFLKAAMAACAMVSMSQGKVHFCDRIRLDQIMDTLDELKMFDPHEGVELFNCFSENIAADSKQGHAKALAAIKAVADDKQKVALLIRLCLAISTSDGQASLVEQIEIVSLCSLLGVNAEDIGLDMQDILANTNTRQG